MAGKRTYGEVPLLLRARGRGLNDELSPALELTGEVELESWRSVSRRQRTNDESVYEQTLSPLDWLTQVWSQVLVEPFVSSMVHSTRSSGCKACQMG